MYYRSVNRGISFTKAGRYTVGLVLALGFFATGSGYNALYLSLSLGLALLIISGLLSEKVMKFCSVENLSQVSVEADTPFTLTFYATNHSPTFSAYGIEYLALGSKTRFGIFSSRFDSVIEGRVLRLDPKQSAEVHGYCAGLRRGQYHSFPVAQRTAYPFGLVIKFRLLDVVANLEVVPKQDLEFGEQLRKSLRARLFTRGGDNEFHSHKSYSPGDSLRRIDWKKSLSGNASWLIKLYEEKSQSQFVLLQLDGSALRATTEPAIYERFLSIAHTACQTILEFGKIPILSFDTNHFLVGEPVCRSALAEFPAFESKERLSFPTTVAPVSPDQLPRLKLGLDSFEWASAEG